MSLSNAAITFSFAGLAEGYCFSGFDRLALDIVNNMSGYLPGQYSVIIDSDTEPSADDRGKLWHKLLPGGAPTGKLFKYFMGKWVSPNPIEAEAESRTWWTGSEADLWSYDGGDGSDPTSSPPTATTGAMWVRDTDYDFRFPLGMGTSPAPYSTTVSPGDTGGEEKHVLTGDEFTDGDHIHTVGRMADNSNDDGVFLTGTSDKNGIGRQITGDSGSNITANLSAKSGSYLVTSGVNSEPTIEAHNNMPPFRVGIWAKRSARQYYTG
jgi:hypothetical protein